MEVNNKLSKRIYTQYNTTPMSAWLPNGQLDDGTLLFGPLNKNPEDGEPILSVTIDGAEYWVKYCCKDLNEDQISQVEVWATTQVRSRALPAP